MPMDYVPTYEEFIEKAETLSDQECVEYCDELISSKAHVGYAMLMKSGALILLKKFEDAINVCDKIIDLSDDRLTGSAYGNKGLSLTRLGKFTEALECHKKESELGKTDKIHFVNVSFALGKLGKYEEALENVEKALELDPNYATAWNNKGFDLHKMGKSEEGLKFVEKALELEPNHQDAIESKQEILQALGRTD